MQENNTALIIGGSSLFGKYLSPMLLNSGKRVIVASPDESEYEYSDALEGFTGSHEGMEWAYMNVLEPQSIKDVLEEFRPGVIFDCAVQNSVGYAWKDPAATVDINVTGAINLFEAVRNMEDYSPRILMAGSGEEYGRMDFDMMPISEELQPVPNNIFASSKVCQDLLANIYFRAYGMDIIILRTFNEIGPGMSVRFSVADFCRQFAECAKSGRKEFTIHTGNANIERDYTDVRDLVRAFLAVAEKGRAGEIYNAGAGRAVPISHVIDILSDITGIKAVIRSEPSRMRPVDTPKFEADIAKIEQDTGWKPEYELKDTIKDMYALYA